MQRCVDLYRINCIYVHHRPKTSVNKDGINFLNECDADVPDQNFFGVAQSFLSGPRVSMIIVITAA